MAIRSIIEVGVDDAAFKRFQAAFNTFQQGVNKTAGTWGKINEQAARTGREIKSATDNLNAQASAASVIIINQDKFQKSSQSSARSWADMAKNSKTFAGQITDATRQLLRWSLITGAISGLLGAGGLFGISRLAQSATSQRRSATGLGVTSGEQGAFGLNFGRFVETNTLLSGVNTALTDPTQRGGLLRGGLTESGIAGKGAADVSVELLRSLKKLADETDERNLGAVHTARGLGQFLSADDFLRLRRMPGNELNDQIGRYRSDRTALNVNPEELRKWNDFTTQLERAGKSIEKVFIDGLTPLTGPLTEFSVGLTEVVKSFFGNPAVRGWVKDAADGLQQFAKYIGTPEFKKDIDDFASGVNKMAKAIGDAVKWIKSLFSDDDGKGKGSLETPPAYPGLSLGDLLRGKKNSPVPGVLPPGTGGDVTSPFIHGSYGGGLDQQSDRVAVLRASLSSGLGISHDASSGILSNLWAESKISGINEVNPLVPGSRGGFGWAQWTGPRRLAFEDYARSHGLNPASDEANRGFLIEELRTKYPNVLHQLQTGQLTPSQAAHIFFTGYESGGDPRLEGSRAGHVANAERISRMREPQPRPSMTNVNISNNTGGNANVTVAKLI